MEDICTFACTINRGNEKSRNREINKTMGVSSVPRWKTNSFTFKENVKLYQRNSNPIILTLPDGEGDRTGCITCSNICRKGCFYHCSDRQKWLRFPLLRLSSLRSRHFQYPAVPPPVRPHRPRLLRFHAFRTLAAIIVQVGVVGVVGVDVVAVAVAVVVAAALRSQL